MTSKFYVLWLEKVTWPSFLCFQTSDRSFNLFYSKRYIQYHWLVDRWNGHRGGNSMLWYWAVAYFTVMCLKVKRVYGRWCTTTVRFLLTLPTSLQYRGRPLVIHIGRSIVAAALVAALEYLMMLIVFILHLAVLLCTTVKVKKLLCIAQYTISQ